MLNDNNLINGWCYFSFLYEIYFLLAHFYLKCNLYLKSKKFIVKAFHQKLQISLVTRDYIGNKTKHVIKKDHSKRQRTKYIAYKHKKLELVVSPFTYPVCSLIHKILKNSTIKIFFWTLLKYEVDFTGQFVLIECIMKFLTASFQKRIFEHMTNRTYFRMKQIFYEKQQLSTYIKIIRASTFKCILL